MSKRRIILISVVLFTIIITIGLYLKWVKPEYDLEKRYLYTFTNKQIKVIKDEFGLNKYDNVILKDMMYSKNYTLWGLGNIIVSITVKDIEFTDTTYKNNYNDTIFISLETNGVTYLKKHKISTKAFYEMLQEESIEIEYIYSK